MTDRHDKPEFVAKALVGLSIFYRLEKGHSKGQQRTAVVSHVHDDGTIDLHVMLRGEHDAGAGETRTAPVAYRAKVARGTENGTWQYSAGGAL